MGLKESTSKMTKIIDPNEIRKAAKFAKDTGDHYLRVKKAGVSFDEDGNSVSSGRTVLLRVKAAGGMLLGEEVSMREGDIGLDVYGVIRDDAEQHHLITWEAMAWAKVVHFDWYEGKLVEVPTHECV